MDTSSPNVCTHPLSSLLRFKMKEKRCTHTYTEEKQTLAKGAQS